MQITLETRNYSEIETEALVSYLFEESDPVQGQLDEIDRGAGGLLRKLVKGGEVSGKMLEFTLIHSPQGLKLRDCCSSVPASANNSIVPRREK